MATSNGKVPEPEVTDSGIRVYLTKAEWIEFRKAPWLLSDFAKLQTTPYVATLRVQFVLPFITGWSLKDSAASDVTFKSDLSLVDLPIEANKAEAIVGAWFQAYYKAQELPLAIN